MTKWEVKTSHRNNGLGLFATQDLAAGDIVLEEAPLAVLGATNGKTKSKTAKTKSKASNKINGMLQAASHELDAATRNRLLELYHPSLSNDNDDNHQIEQGLVATSREALQQWLQQCHQSQNNNKNNNNSSKLDLYTAELRQKIMLVWACNAFDGGAVYATTSRINHSCRPNALVVEQSNTNNANTNNNNNKIRIQTLTAIPAGTEITISYLGLWWYAATTVRRALLQRDKYFWCTCDRCTADWDPATRIPCTVRHRRATSKQQQLPEAVQYDDDDDTTVTYMMWNASKQAYVSSSDNDEHVDTTIHKVVDAISQKTRHFLEGHFRAHDNNSNDNNDEYSQLLLEEHIALASSVLGARHWTTNLLLLVHLDRGLQAYHRQLLWQVTGNTQNNDNPLDPDEQMMELAQHIDQAQSIERYLAGLFDNIDNADVHVDNADNVTEEQKHKQNDTSQYARDAAGHLLSDVWMGVARALVALGDPVSVRYAHDTWLPRLTRHAVYLSPGRKAVLEALSRAPSNNNNNDNDNNNEPPPAKRLKVPP